MINPTLIRKNPPAVLRLFAAAGAGRTGQRAQSPPAGGKCVQRVFACVFVFISLFFFFGYQS